jgi:hypothetical protein
MVKAAADYAAAEAKRLARKAKRKSNRAIDSNGKWKVVNGVQFIPDPTNPRGQREICLTDAAAYSGRSGPVIPLEAGRDSV